MKALKRLSEKSYFAPMLAFFGACIIGVSPIFVRMVNIGPVSAGFYRFFFSLPLLVLWVLFERRQESNKNLAKVDLKGALLMLCAGGAFALDVALWNQSIYMTHIVNSALLNNFTAFFVPIYMWVLFSDRPKASFVFASVFGVVGAFLLAGGDLHMSNETIKGDLVALSSALCFSVYIVAVKFLRARYASATVMLGTTAVSSLFIGIIAYFQGETFMPPAWTDWLVLISLACIVHVLGQGLFAYSMSRVSASYSAVIVLVGPVIAGFLAWLFFSEAMSTLQFIGCSVVLLSILALNFSEKLKKRS